MTDKLYDKDRDVQALGDYWLKHLSAMTEEDLHSKSDIAAELAWRDKQIDELKQQLASAHDLLRSSASSSFLENLDKLDDAGFPFAEELFQEFVNHLNDCMERKKPKPPAVVAGVDLAATNSMSTTAFVERYANGSYHWKDVDDSSDNSGGQESEL